ncbi:sensor domain-containing diguanylate cyclase [Polynucleobacter kasalickyi]|uniref:diguanylate cyclase n=1 Tax=Polynucleobacter kasalickyi TaxID=1938817 RepID=A0A1W1YN21_9BURK|nr:diguanylate cyclase [Polynucleobacter kasalickyi]SMC37211.1 diguanylate cyclase (GGDEF) domain-containing protein [Polynucleobacter kasalickyi]
MPLKLGSKFTIFIAAVFLLLTAVAWFLTNKIITDVNRQWSNQLSERQVQFDIHRTLMPLIKEITLARQLATEPAIIDMAMQEENSNSTNRAIETLNKYRGLFRDKNYFYANAKNGNYYYNDSQNSYAGKELRYQLSPNLKQDEWFYATLKDSAPYQINLNYDAHLDTTKAWINVMVKHADKNIGIVGTGIDLTAFLNDTVDIGQTGIHNIFIDRDMAVQLFRNPDLIDYAGITKEKNERRRVDAILKDPKDLAALQKVMLRLAKTPKKIETISVNYEGKPHILGIEYLPEIGWFDLTLMESKGILIADQFLMVPILITVIFFLTLISLWLFLNRIILKPIEVLHQSALKVERGDFSVADNIPVASKDEIGQVAFAFKKMTLSLREHTSNLEKKIFERTKELESLSMQLQLLNKDLNKLSRTDYLTQVRNRLDLDHCLDVEQNQSIRTGQVCSLILMDIDHFKEVNDLYGHHAGDLILKNVASSIRERLSSADIFGRWGGEEFLLLLPNTPLALAQEKAESIRRFIASLNNTLNMKTITVTMSLGVSIFIPGISTSIEKSLKEADRALYLAKNKGRNTVVVNSEANG